MLYYPKFSHIYVESQALFYDWTKKILNQFPKSEVIEINHYKDFFSRPGQNFQVQKRSQKLILAVKEDAFLYPGNDFVQSFGYSNFHYNTPILNCLYNCEYCYLQGIFPSANMVVFVNVDDFFKATDKAISNRKNLKEPFYLALSYDTDLLATESRIPLSRAWIDYASTRLDLVVEIRTKSAAIETLKGAPATDRSILAWTLSPEAIVRRFENQTPSLKARIDSAQKAIAQGFPVRLCFDPIIPVSDWQALYFQCFEEVFSVIAPSSVRDISLGFFRMSKNYYKNAGRVRPDSMLFHYPWSLENNAYVQARDKRETMVATLCEKLLKYLPEEKIEIWK